MFSVNYLDDKNKSHNTVNKQCFKIEKNMTIILISNTVLLKTFYSLMSYAYINQYKLYNSDPEQDIPASRLGGNRSDTVFLSSELISEPANSIDSLDSGIVVRDPVLSKTT